MRPGWRRLSVDVTEAEWKDIKRAALDRDLTVAMLVRSAVSVYLWHNEAVVDGAKGEGQ